MSTLIFLVFAAALLPQIFGQIASIANCTGVCNIFLTILPWAVMAGIVYAVLKHYGLV
jgi:hypothetical protein